MDLVVLVDKFSPWQRSWPWGSGGPGPLVFEQEY